jgi:hypothetical protein
LRATKRIIYNKPAFSAVEVDALLDIVKLKHINCDLYMESGNQMIRLGFGETAALDLIYRNLDYFNVHFSISM